MFKIVLFLFVILTNFNSVQNTDFYSSLTKLEGLLTTEEHVIHSLKEYLKNEKDKLEEINNYVEYLRRNNNQANKNKEKYVENPINAFFLIKRLSEEWNHIKTLLMDDSLQEFFKTTSIELPSQTDMTGAIEALIRLQETYNLNTTLMANGELSTLRSSMAMTSYDCFNMGMYLHNNYQEFTLAITWFQEAQKRLQYEKNPTIYKESILEYLASSYFNTNNTSKAVNIIQGILKDDSKNSRLLEVLKIYETSVPVVPEDSGDSYFVKPIMEKYKKLCRGDLQMPEIVSSKLKCFYYKPFTEKFLQIAPFKVEEAYKSPRILIFHEIMSNEEISLLRNLALPKLRRIQLEYSTKNDKPSKYRVGELAWFNNSDHQFIRVLRQRMNDMTGLSMDHAESLQVLNYGMAGQGDPHYDYFDKDPSWGNAFVENRLATILIYMNNVEKGGATVFPFLNLSIQARKGTAAVWYNLHSNLERDSRTVHGACPVLMAQKWISTQWIRDIYQTFHKPCELEPREMTPMYELLSWL